MVHLDFNHPACRKCDLQKPYRYNQKWTNILKKHVVQSAVLCWLHHLGDHLGSSDGIYIYPYIYNHVGEMTWNLVGEWFSQKWWCTWLQRTQRLLLGSCRCGAIRARCFNGIFSSYLVVPCICPYFSMIVLYTFLHPHEAQKKRCWKVFAGW